MRFLPGINVVACLVAAVVTIGSGAPASAEGDACVGDCDINGAIGITDLTTMINAALGVEQSTTCGVTGVPTIEQVVLAVNYANSSCPVVGTPTPTPTLTVTPTLTPTRDPSAPLGHRHFEVNPNNGGFFVALGGLSLRLGGFMGQTNGVAERAYFDLEAGVPDAEGRATINITGASEYLAAQANIAGMSFAVCLKLLAPVTNAGVIDCDGGSDYSIGLRADHHIGELGVDGFSAEQCTSMGGILEEGTRLCKAGKEFEECHADSDCDTVSGMGDGQCGLTQSLCVSPPTGATCNNDSQCDSTPGMGDGQCGQSLPHIGVCNGQFTPVVGTGDTGPGSLTFAPIAGLTGLPVRLNIERALPCGDEGSGQPLGFALTSTRAQAVIEDVDNRLGQNLNFALTQATTATPKQFELQNFSCDQWTDSAGPGCMGLVAPVLHQNMGSDVVTAFKLCGK